MPRATRARKLVLGQFGEVPDTSTEKDQRVPATVPAEHSTGELGVEVRHCDQNPKSHRHLPAHIADNQSGCRFCGQPIERAHVKSTWWTLKATDPSKKPSKLQLRRGRKLLRKAFAKKDQMGSTRRDAKRNALAYAEQRTGKSLSWKAARKLVRRWAREERMATV